MPKIKKTVNVDTSSKKQRIVTPQSGMQTNFSRSNCDICFAGGVLNPQPLTSYILTPDGFKMIADIKAGDKVVGIDNKEQIITHCDREGEKECVRIVLDDGRSAECALDHKWWIIREGQGDTTAIAFELLENYQICKEKGIRTDVSVFVLENGAPTPVRLKEVVEIGKKEVACIGVSNSDELYITDDYLITKNCGKAQPYSSKVLTPKGYVRMGDLKVGDELCTYDGKTQKVVRIYEKGVQQIYRVEFEHGYVECTEDHLWRLVDNKTGKEYTMSLKTIMERGFDKRLSVVCPKSIFFRSWDVKLPIEPYSFGRILGLGGSVLSESMIAKLALLGITKELFIPDIYIYSSERDRKELMRGFLTSVELEYLSASSAQVYIEYKIAKGIADIVLSLGGTANIEIQDSKYAILSITMRGLSSTSKRIISKKIVAIHKRGEEQARCILVSDQSHLYITDNFTVTHNTYAAVLMVAEPSLDPRFRAVFTRRNLANLKAGGGIVDEFMDAYGDYATIKISDNPRIQFPSGSYVDCIHIADESPNKFMERAKGWQYDVAYLDELTSYEFSTFSIIGTRVRGQASFTGHIFGTTNPKRGHWTRKMLDWYVGIDGFIIPERDGVVRYCYQMGDTVDDVIFGDSKEEVYAICRQDIDRKLVKSGSKDWTYKDMIRSFVFYKGTMADNKASIGKNASYIGSVAAVGGKRAQQLLEGNFNVDEDEDDKAPISSHDAQQVFNTDPQTNGDYWITVDLADVGSDNLVALYWNGFHVVDTMIVSDSTPRMNYEKIKMFATKHGVPDTHIIYDATHGTYMYDYMPDAIPFISAGSPRGLYALMSDRLKDECYLRLVDMITNQRISISEEVAKSRYYHKGINEEYTIQSEFLEECAVVRFREKPNGKMKLWTKKEMNSMLGKDRSMDFIDPMAMRTYPILHLPYGDELMGEAVKDAEQAISGSGNFNVYDDDSWF